MYDDLLGKKPVKDNIGLCGECKHGRLHVITEDNLYCLEIKKYVHKYSTGCLKFIKRRDVKC